MLNSAGAIRRMWAAGACPALGGTDASGAGAGRKRDCTLSVDSEPLSFGWASVVINPTRRWRPEWLVDGLSMKSLERSNSENNIARTQHATVANFIQMTAIPEV